MHYLKNITSIFLK